MTQTEATGWTLIVDHGDHISETRYKTYELAIDYLRNGYTYGLLERAGYSTAQIDALEPEEFRALLAERGLVTRLVECRRARSSQQPTARE